jgi:uncharacterized protein with von Willebrand factor type A (vWA) domain
MRVEQNDVVQFQPLTVHLETQHEVDTFKQLVHMAYQESHSGTDIEALADKLRDMLDATGGWQSSSYNC